MAIEKISLNTPYLSLYVENNEGMVFNHIQQCLYKIPALSIAILAAIDSGENQDQIIHDIATHSQLATKLIKTYYQQVNALLSQDPSEQSYIDGRYPELTPALLKNKKQSPTTAKTYRVAQTIFSVNTESPEIMSEIIDTLLPCEYSTNTVDVMINIKCHGALFQIIANGIASDHFLHVNQVMPELIDHLQILAFQHSNYQYCFHGAAIETPQGTVILPGTSGAGKSTLSAELAAQENPLFSDEMIVLDRNFNLTTLNLPIAIKSGSWKVLQTKYPQLAYATTWQRVDGRQLRYVWPSAFATQSADTNNKTSFLLINPCYQSADGSPTEQSTQIGRTRPLSVTDTLTILTDSGYQLGFELNEEGLENLISFIQSIKRYQVHYSSSEQALSTLDTLWQ